MWYISNSTDGGLYTAWVCSTNSHVHHALALAPKMHGTPATAVIGTAQQPDSHKCAVTLGQRLVHHYHLLNSSCCDLSQSTTARTPARTQLLSIPAKAVLSSGSLYLLQ
eukprot:GHRR01014497.1.p2 GENE.GHRR01014497.1~~GHRR01014497.1.p2  ORF type:complete len:109 (-),score=24.69 GHRR01014497.1:1387-1713(-)